MPLARINGHLLHFVHIPKTGGSSVNTYMRSRGSLALYSRVPLVWMDVSPQHLHRGAATAVIPPGFCDRAFTILRDPVARMVSEYRYRAARWHDNRGPNGAQVIEWHDGGSFEGDFDAWVAAVLRDWARDPRLYDNHIRPQSDYWWPGLSTFLFEDGLGRVFDWIDETCHLSHEPRIHENPGARVSVRMSDDTERAIRSFYRIDTNLIRRLNRARAVAAAPDPERITSPGPRESGQLPVRLIK
ncbi:MAG: sulfotransferase family 2 domain-containing protein [Silicimonas sp.]|nr:sulfotransferase family 2 domain-containing protein [Silicimonas sp.]